jgi:O-antigen ligase
MWSSATLLAAAFVASQLFLGGWYYPALAAPAYVFAGAAAILGGLTFWKAQDAPGAWCVGAVLLLAAYLFWRQAESPDAYAARVDAWLVLGVLAVYLTTAWQLREDGPRWLVLTVIFAAAVTQVAIVLVQFSSHAAFHPLADWALRLRLPTGEEGLPNRGFVTGTLASRGALSSVLQASTFLALGLLVWGRVRAATRLLLFWITAIGFVGLVLTLSRAAYLGVTAGLVVFALLGLFILNRGAVVHRFWLISVALLLTLLPLLVAFFVGTESLLVRFRLGELGGDSFREALWFTVVPPMLKLDPWFGVGANMFDQLSLRYRAGAFDLPPVHAHNDWLQLLIEYGRVGLLLGVLVFIVHFATGWRNTLRLARDSAAIGWWPQSMELGLLTGSIAALTAQGVHSFFDYRLHVVSTALLVALAAGWIAGARLGPEERRWMHLPAWLRALAIMPAIPGAILLWWVVRDGPAEMQVLRAENAVWRSDFPSAAAAVAEGIALDPDHPRLLALAGEHAVREWGSDFSRPERGFWAESSSTFWFRSLAARHADPTAAREYALSLSHRGLFEQSLPWHLRAIVLDPDYATPYEYLGYSYLLQGKRAEALRLFRLARRLPGSVSPPQSPEELDRVLERSTP